MDWVDVRLWSSASEMVLGQNILSILQASVLKDVKSVVDSLSVSRITIHKGGY